MARRNVISLVTKSDPSSKNLPNDMPNNRHLTSVDQIGNHPDRTRFVIEPRKNEQRREVYKAYDKAFVDQGWCIYTDELYWVEHHLKLPGDPVIEMLTQGRSQGITSVNGVQRPSWVTRFALSEPIHVLIGRVEGRDLKTVLDATSPTIKNTILSIGKYQFAWYHRGENRAQIVDLDMIRPGGFAGESEEKGEKVTAK